MDAAHLVREARLRAGLTQAELAARSGTTQSALARLEAGTSSPAFTRVVDLVERCGLGLRVRIVDPAADLVPERERAVAADAWALLAPLVRHGVRFVVSGLAAAAARGLADRERPPTIVPDDARANLLLMGVALRELGARVRVEDGSLPFVGTPESLLSRPRWELVGPDGPLDLVFAPPGTRGYRDLVRDASVVSVGGLELPVASLRDAIRELEAAGADPELVHRLRVALGPNTYEPSGAYRHRARPAVPSRFEEVPPMRLDQTLGHASAHQVVVRVQMRGPDGVEVRECPAAEFEPSDRGVTMGAIFVPWQRIYRYDTIVEQGFIPEGHETETRTLQRVVFEDESGVARSVEVPLDRYETGPWHLTIVIERKVDRQRGSLSIRKVCIPWGRVIETERVFTVPDAQEVPEPPDPTVKEWFDVTELEDGADDEPADVVAARDATDGVVVVATTERDDAERDAALAKLFEIPEAEPTPEPERTG